MKKVIISAFAAIITLGSFAQTGPGHQRTHIMRHPRVNEVNKREDNQEKRITADKKDGDITKAQAHSDRTDLRNINREKRAMRKQDGSHLTKTDKKDLNQQLNANSQTIKHQ